MQTQDKRIIDINGYWSVPDNPISKVGVFPYKGHEIGAPEPDRVYQVYRPAEELSDPDAMASFNLMPIIDEHEFLGKDATPAEKKGVQGTTGEGAAFEYPYLKNGLRIYSQFLQELIDAGKTELSPAYRCTYEFTPGMYKGKSYDAIQRNIRGNHLALVVKGRTGPDVAVQDSYLITTDSMEFIMDKEQIKALIAEVLAEQAADADKDDDAKDEDRKDDTKDEKPDKAEDALAKLTESMDEIKESLAKAEDSTELVEGLQASMDALTDAITKAQDEKPVDEKPALDSADVIKQIQARDKVVESVKPHIGTFDTSEMVTAQDVAAYAVEKLGLTGVDEGDELSALTGYLQAVKPDSIVQDKAPTTGTDTASKIWKE